MCHFNYIDKYGVDFVRIDNLLFEYCYIGDDYVTKFYVSLKNVKSATLKNGRYYALVIFGFQNYSGTCDFKAPVGEFVANSLTIHDLQSRVNIVDQF